MVTFLECMSSLGESKIKGNSQYSNIQYHFWKTQDLFKFTFRNLIMIVQILCSITLLMLFPFRNHFSSISINLILRLNTEVSKEKRKLRFNSHSNSKFIALYLYMGVWFKCTNVCEFAMCLICSCYRNRNFEFFF